MTPDELLDELRRECRTLTHLMYGHIPDDVVAELAALIAKREHAAAERMRERCAEYGKSIAGTETSWLALCDRINELEPEETNE